MKNKFDFSEDKNDKKNKLSFANNHFFSTTNCTNNTNTNSLNSSDSWSKPIIGGFNLSFLSFLSSNQKSCLSRVIVVFLLSIFNFQFSISQAQTDSVAARLVDRYLDILNIDALPQDSMLVLTTTITTPGSSDTITMRRLFQPPQMFRVEVRDAIGLQSGLYTNGKGLYRAYAENKGWGVIAPDNFYLRLTGFDFRGPLYHWRTGGLMMKYIGKVDVAQKGEELDAVRVEVDGMYTRLYMFEESGLLSVIVELDEGANERSLLKDTHIQWKCEHEYNRVGPTLLPSLESFMRNGQLTVLRTEMHLEPRDDKPFNHD